MNRWYVRVARQDALIYRATRGGGLLLDSFYFEAGGFYTPDAALRHVQTRLGSITGRDGAAHFVILVDLEPEAPLR